MLFGQLTFDGLSMGLVFVILACGFVIIMSISKILFIAYGAFYTIGAYGTWYAIDIFHINYFFGLILGVIITSIIGLACYFLIFQRLKMKMGERAFLATLIAAVGLQLLLTQAGVVLYGNQSRSIPNVFPGVLHVLGINMTSSKLVLIALSVIVAIALFWVYEKTSIGRSMRAVSYIPDAAALQGINNNRVYLISLGLGCALAGIAGAILAPTYGMDPQMGANVIWMVMLITMLGGLDSLMGCVVGGLIIGEVMSWGQFYMGSLIQIVIFVGIAITVYFKPYGLLGRGIDLGV